MIVFLLLTFVMALSVAWLLIVPIISADLPRQQKWKTIILIIIATILFPFSLYWFITF